MVAQSLHYLPFGFLQKKLADPYSKVNWLINMLYVHVDTFCF